MTEHPPVMGPLAATDQQDTAAFDAIVVHTVEELRRALRNRNRPIVVEGPASLKWWLVLTAFLGTMVAHLTAVSLYAISKGYKIEYELVADRKIVKAGGKITFTPPAND